MKFFSIISSIAVIATSSMCFAGAVGGAKVSKDVVLAYDTDMYVVPFYGNSVAHVEVKGDGQTDLDCFVYDNNNNLIVSDTDSSDYCVLEWIPKWNGYFKIYVKNMGGTASLYMIGTN